MDWFFITPESSFNHASCQCVDIVTSELDFIEHKAISQVKICEIPYNENEESHRWYRQQYNQPIRIFQTSYTGLVLHFLFDNPVPGCFLTFCILSALGLIDHRLFAIQLQFTQSIAWT